MEPCILICCHPLDRFSLREPLECSFGRDVNRVILFAFPSSITTTHLPLEMPEEGFEPPMLKALDLNPQPLRPLGHSSDVSQVGKSVWEEKLGYILTGESKHSLLESAVQQEVKINGKLGGGTVRKLRFGYKISSY